MSFLPRFHIGIKKNHGVTDQLPYLTRYKTADLSLLDHYRHLCQLLPLYEALETKIKDPKFLIKLPNEFNSLYNRVASLKTDIQFLEKAIPAHHLKQPILPSTQNYLDYLKTLQPDNAAHQENIFAHFLVRILGDLFGGQQIKKDILKLFERTKMTTKPALDEKNIEPINKPGVNFYEFKPFILREFGSWLNTQDVNMDMDKVVESANHSFDHHINIFEELEKTRVALQLQAPKIVTSSSFFSKPKIAIAVGVGVALTGVAYAAHYYLRKSQN